MNRFKLAEKLGFDPPFVFENDNQEIEYFEGRIYYDRLGNILKQRKPFLFDFNEYKNNSRNIVDNGMGGIEIERPKSPLVVTDDNGVSHALSLSGKLNMRLGSVQVMPRKVFFNLDIDVNSKITYTKKIKYQFLEEEAIILETLSYTDYELLSQHIGTGNGENVKQRITKKFNEAFRKAAKDTGTLKWLYDQAPQFVITQRDDQTLLSDLRKFITYDLDSWFIDSSTAIMKILIGFENPKIAYDYFEKNPQEIIAAYSAINNDIQKENLATLFTTLSYVYAPRERQNGATFTIGKDYFLDSNLFIKNNQEVVNLQQLKYGTKSVEVSRFGEEGTVSGTLRVAEEVPQTTTQFHPLDLVVLKNQETGETELVCALQVKLLSDRAEWAQVILVTTAVITVIALVASLGTLAAGATGVAAIIAVAELIVSIGDLIFLIKRANLDGTEEGDWFIDHWEEISIGVGVLSIGTALHQGFLKHGPRVLGRLNRVRNATAIAVQKRITQLLTEIQIELYFFFKQGIVRVSFEPFSFVLKKFGEVIGKKMYQYEIQLTTIAQKDGDIRALVYRGDKITEGTEKELRIALNEIFPFNVGNSGIIKILDEITQESFGLLKRSFKIFQGNRYTILHYENLIRWKLSNPKFNWFNEAKLEDGVLKFDFNTFGVKGLGQQWVDEAFEIFGNKIKEVKAEWTRNPAYPNGESLGMREFWKNLSNNGWDEYKAIMDSRFYKTMNKKGFGKIKEPFRPFDKEEEIVVILQPNKT